jgi:Ca2+-binding EF-hand superfamily protein
MEMDKENKKAFSISQLKQAFAENSINMTDAEINEIFKQFDHEKNGRHILIFRKLKPQNNFMI